MIPQRKDWTVRERIASQVSTLDGLDLVFAGDAPVLYHCHHFNLFLDQTIDDALGVERGQALRTRAARDAAHHLLAGLSRNLGIETPAERIALAQTLFSMTGHGTLEIAAPDGAGEARGTYLHYGHSWVEKYGHLVKRRIPADAVAAGFAAGAVEVAYGLPAGSLHVREVECVGLRDPACRFEIERIDAPQKAPAAPGVGTHAPGPSRTHRSTGVTTISQYGSPRATSRVCFADQVWPRLNRSL